MNKLLVFGVMVMLFIVGFYSFDPNIKVEERELEFNIEYAPSQNLAIMEGRFDDARESIQRVERLNG